jgi:hypothetical protein
MDNRPVDPDLPDYEPGEPRYNSLDEVMFEIHAEHGPAVLREVLGMLEIGREDLEDCAAALEVAGKPSIAAIVREIAAKAPSGIDLDNPYDESDSTNWRYWRQSWARNRWVRSGEMEKSLRAQKPRNAIKPKPHRH